MIQVEFIQRFAARWAQIILFCEQFRNQVFRQLSATVSYSDASILRFYAEQFRVVFGALSVVSASRLYTLLFGFSLRGAHLIRIIGSPSFFYVRSTFGSSGFVRRMRRSNCDFILLVILSAVLRNIGFVFLVPRLMVLFEIRLSAWGTSSASYISTTFFACSHLETLHGYLKFVGNRLVKQTKGWPALSQQKALYANSI